MALIQEIHENVLVVSINRFEKRNAVDRETAAELCQAFERFDLDASLKVAVLTGCGGTFCAGADLTAFAAGSGNCIEFEGSAPMGPTRMRLSKPVIAAVEGHAIAGGLELAIWCDLRVAAEDSILGVYCRRVGVPLIDLGTIRLPRLIGQSRALDLILTGRGVSANEALTMGLVNRVTAPGKALESAVELAKQIAAFPEIAMRHDRLSVYEQWDLEESDAIANELRHGLNSLESGESKSGAKAFGQRRRATHNNLQDPK